MYAIIKTSGKQYKVEVGTVFDVDRVAANVGDVIDLKDSILMTSDNGTVNIGEPTVAGTVKLEAYLDKVNVILFFAWKSLVIHVLFLSYGWFLRKKRKAVCISLCVP